LCVDSFLKKLLEQGTFRKLVDVKLSKDPQEDSLETLHVPILIDDLMDDSTVENLVGLVLEQEDQVMHLVDQLSIFHVLSTPSRKDLLSKSKYEISKIFVLSKLDAFLWELKAHLNFVENRTAHGENQSLSLPDGWRL